MSPAVLIDYGCHSFTYRLATRLYNDGFPIRYFVNGSLESPNLLSLASWVQGRPGLVRSISCRKAYGKMSLRDRLRGEVEWASECIQALEQERPSAVIVSCVPLYAVTRIQSWAKLHAIPLIYWLQDLQGRAIHDLLGRKFGLAGRAVGSVARMWEQRILSRSDMVITITAGHERELPDGIRRNQRFSLLENWANIEEIPELPASNHWAVGNALHNTKNILYSGTLGYKHDLAMFLTLAAAFRHRPDIRIVLVSSGRAADYVRQAAANNNLPNLVVLPFQSYENVPSVLASASVLIAPLDPSAGSFCVPSKVLSYLCAGRPVVIAIDADNAAARIIQAAQAGSVVAPGDSEAFVAAVHALLDDPARRVAEGRSARAYAQRTFGLDRVVSRFIDILARANVILEPCSIPHASATPELASLIEPRA
jgi:colanic acid biosynthesis glycosyl transferase WcaI